MQDTDKTREQLLAELVDLRQSMTAQGRANLLLNNSRIISTKRFAAGIAHEINNPLGIISGFSELALLNVDLLQPLRDDIGVIHSECNRAARILHDLLSFVGDRPLTTVQVDVHALIKQALKLKSNEFDSYHIKVTVQCSPNLPENLVDPDQLIEVLLNVLDNAQQAMTEANGGGPVELSALANDNGVRIKIIDTGPGIPLDNLGQIFQPFFTTKEVGKGSGLGLSISQEKVHQHGGYMWAESAPNTGSTIPLEFPLEFPSIPKSSVNGDSVKTHASEPAEARGITKRVLVVNDALSF